MKMCKKANEVEPLEQVIDSLNSRLKNHHIERLQSGKCTIELGFILSDVMTDFERISDHCSNIAVCVSQIHSGSFDTHEYLHALKKERRVLSQSTKELEKNSISCHAESLKNRLYYVTNKLVTNPGEIFMVRIFPSLGCHCFDFITISQMHYSILLLFHHRTFSQKIPTAHQY